MISTPVAVTLIVCITLIVICYIGRKDTKK